MRYFKIPTSHEVWAVIHARHRGELIVFEAFSGPLEVEHGEHGKIVKKITAHGFLGAGCPLVRAESSWEEHPETHRWMNEKHEYWLCAPHEEQEE